MELVEQGILLYYDVEALVPLELVLQACVTHLIQITEIKKKKE